MCQVLKLSAGPDSSVGWVVVLREKFEKKKEFEFYQTGNKKCSAHIDHKETS
jgi:hypothetical protein